MDFFKKSMERFYTLPDKEWALFSAIWTPVQFQKNEILTEVGEIEKCLYFVKEGVLRGFYQYGKTDFTVGFSYKGDLSGIPDSFFNQVPSMYFLETLTICKLLKTSYEKIIRLYEQSHMIERMSRIMVEKMLLGLSMRHIELQCCSAEERFKVFLRRSPHLLQLVPQKYLASYLSMTPETFSRLIRNVRI